MHAVLSEKCCNMSVNHDITMNNVTTMDNIYHYTATGILIVHRWQQEKGITGTHAHVYTYTFIHSCHLLSCVLSV
jgi:hypothetical protein